MDKNLAFLLQTLENDTFNTLKYYQMNILMGLAQNALKR